MEWYYILGIVSYGIFIVQFILSNLGISDTDIDVDFDGNVDFDVSSLLSFKGLVHFAMGFSGWLMLSGKVTTIDFAIAAVIGIIFMIILYYLYRLCMKFNSEPTTKVGIQLVGSSATVYVPYVGDKYICTLPDSRELVCVSSSRLTPGDVVKIESYINGVYHVSK